MARHGGTRAGRWPVQLRFKTDLTSEEYVKRQAWRDATLTRCPLHPNGACSFARHGTYQRVDPRGAHIPRWYCPEGHCTFSLLADCFASRLPGTLADLEQVVAEVEKAKSLEVAANHVRPDDIALPGAICWTRRRAKHVHNTLTILLDLVPEQFPGYQPTVTSFRHRLHVDCVLYQLRGIADAHLATLPPPLGFAPSPLNNAGRRKRVQHNMGPDPPPTIH